MGRITSGVGLVSGINSRDIIDQLMQLESRPKSVLQGRIESVGQQRTAYTELSARLTSLRLSATTLKKPSSFQNATSTSSDENVLTATASAGAAVGSYTFQVARLVTTQQAVSRGFADVSTAKVGAGTITIETGGGEVTAENRLSDLNGGAGVKRGSFRITDRSGATTLIDASSAVSLQDVVKKINNNTLINVRATINGEQLVVNDLTGRTTSRLIIQDVGSGTTAAGLGIVGNVNANVINGTDINSIGRLTSLDTLNDGRGVRRTSAASDLNIRLTNGNNIPISLTNARTVGDVLDAINTAGTGRVTASVVAGSNGIRLRDNTGNGAITVTALNSSLAATDLGILAVGSGGIIDGTAVATELDTVSLRSLKGGQGITTGSISIRSRAAGSGQTINLSSARSVQDVVDLINAGGAGVTAALNRAGNGIQLTDTSGGTNNLIVAEVGGGSTAAALGLLGTYDNTVATVQGSNLQRQYVSENTLLSNYNGGKGVAPGKFRITDRVGNSAVVDLSQQNETRISDVIAEINSRGLAVTASINANGDGLLLTATSGTGTLKVENVDSSTASDLGIEGQALAATPTIINGSLERTVTTDANDTLTTLSKKINDLGFGVSASIINDGTTAEPFRLSITSRNSGRAGRFVFDSGATKLAAANLVEAKDAAVFVGDPTAAEPLLITSSKNQLSNVIRGVNVELTGASASPVTLSITNSVDNVVEEITKFSTAFNELSTKIDTLTKFDTQTNTRGLLLGDSAVRQVQSEIFSMLNRSLPAGGKFRILADVGLKVGAGGALTFDEDKFRTAYADDPDAVQTLFTQLAGGLSEGTPLSVLNNGAGVRTAPGGAADLRVTARDGTNFNVTLANAFTLRDVINAINTAAAGKVTAAVNDTNSGLTLTDSTGSTTSALIVAALNGSQAAADLGIATSSTTATLAGAVITLPQSRTIAGAGAQIELAINKLIDPVDGILTRQNKALEQRSTQFQERITNLDKLLEKKRERLERQFAQLESVLSGLQGQQSALGQIQSIAPG